MSELTTEEVLEQAASEGTNITAKLLADYVKRGLLDPPRRRGKRTGGVGSQSYWHQNTLARVMTIKKLREEGESYEAIADQLPPLVQPRAGAKRLSVTIWMPRDRAEFLESTAKQAGMPLVEMLQLGANLFHSAPAPARDLAQNPLVFAFSARGYIDLPKTEQTFLDWGRMAYHYMLVRDGVLQGKLPCPDVGDAYILWRLVQDSYREHRRVAPARKRSGARASAIVLALAALQITEEVVEREGEVVGHLTMFGDRVRLFRPDPAIARDKARCIDLAHELKAALIAGDGHDFDHHDDVQALGLIADWLRVRVVIKNGVPVVTDILNSAGEGPVS